MDRIRKFLCTLLTYSSFKNFRSASVTKCKAHVLQGFLLDINFYLRVFLLQFIHSINIPKIFTNFPLHVYTLNLIAALFLSNKVSRVQIILFQVLFPSHRLRDLPSGENRSSIYPSFSDLPPNHASFPSDRNSSNLFMFIFIKIIVCSLHSTFQSKHQVQRGLLLNVLVT